MLELLGNADWGGVESFVAQLVPALPAFVRATVVVPGEGDYAQRLRARDVRVVVYPVDDGRGLAQSVMRTVELVRRLRVDVIHAHLANAHAVAALVCAATGVPVFTTIHGSSLPMRDVEAMAHGWSRIGAVAEVAYAHARFLGAAADRVALVPNGVDTAHFSPGPAGALRAAWGVPPGAPLVGFVGRVAGEKGPVDFANLAGDVALARPDAHFVVAGDGPLLGRVGEIARRRGFAGRLHRPGWIADVRAVHREIDVLVMTSFNEGAPLALLEAMACEVPAVATAVGGVPEIVVDGVCGLLVPPGDPVAGARGTLALLDDSAAREAMGRAARARVMSRFTLGAHVARVVEELLRTARRRDPGVPELALARSVRSR